VELKRKSDGERVAGPSWFDLYNFVRGIPKALSSVPDYPTVGGFRHDREGRALGVLLDECWIVSDVNWAEDDNVDSVEERLVVVPRHWSHAPSGRVPSAYPSLQGRGQRGAAAEGLNDVVAHLLRNGTEQGDRRVTPAPRDRTGDDWRRRGANVLNAPRGGVRVFKRRGDSRRGDDYVDTRERIAAGQIVRTRCNQTDSVAKPVRRDGGECSRASEGEAGGSRWRNVACDVPNDDNVRRRATRHN
jgi:hypothetical protein